MNEPSSINQNHLNSAIHYNKQQPKLLVLLSGKRASGKDYVANLLDKAFSERGFKVCRTALGNINKQVYANLVGIDVERLLNDRAFKEEHRVAIVEHHTKRNSDDPEWCLKLVFEKVVGSDIMILSDLRTLADLIWFQKQKIPVVLLRINASDGARKECGWDPSPVKDMLHTETDLDNFKEWSALVDNSDNTENGILKLQNWIDMTIIPKVMDAIGCDGS